MILTLNDNTVGKWIAGVTISAVTNRSVVVYATLRV